MNKKIAVMALVVVGILLSGCIEKANGDAGNTGADPNRPPLQAPELTLEQERDMEFFARALEEQDASSCDSIQNLDLLKMCRDIVSSSQ